MKFARSGISVVLCLMASRSMALGLGNIEVSSPLGRPLEAEIPLIMTGDPNTSLDELRIDIPGYKEHVRLGFHEPILVGGVRLRLVEAPSGTTHIRISTRRPVNEPILSFVVRVVSPTARVLKEYTVLLDPALKSHHSTFMAGFSTRKTPVATQRGPVTSASRFPETADLSRPPTGDERYGPVRAGETLSGILHAAYPQQRARLEQVAQIVFARNRRAFLRGNKNLLMQGSTLLLPLAQDLEKLLAALDPLQTAKGDGSSAAKATPGEQLTTYGPVRAGETLYGIAKSLSTRGQGNLQAIMRRIFERNPEAFIGNDMNLLRQGAVLDIEISEQPAPRELVQPDAEIPPTPLADAGSANTASPVAVSDESSAPLSERPGAQAVTTPEAEKVFEEQLLAVKEELTREADLSRDLTLRLAQTEETIRQMHATVDRLDAQIDVATKILTEQENKPALPVEESITVVGASRVGLETAPVTGEKAIEPQSSLSASASNPAPPEKPAAADTSSGTSILSALTPQWLVLVVLLTLGLLMAAARWRRTGGTVKTDELFDRRDENSQPAREKLAALRANYGGGKSGAEAGAQVSEIAGESDQVEVTEFMLEAEVAPPHEMTLPLGGKVLETDSVRASGFAQEAAVYIAYGRYDDARESIRKAIALEPHRDDHKVVLLTIYESTGRHEEANTLAGSLLSRRENLNDKVRAQVEDIQRRRRRG